MQFEQLVKNAITSHEFKPICVKDKATKERHRKNSAARYNRLKDDPEFKRKRSEANKKRRNTDEYRKFHAQEMRIWRAKQSPEWKQKELQRLRQHNPKPKQSEPTKTFHGIQVINVKLTKDLTQ